MKHAHSLALLLPLLCTTAAFTPAERPAPVHTYSFQHESVLGTSMELTFVAASEKDAAAAEAAALSEVERVRRIISTWDSTSEVSALIRNGRIDHPSAELLDVLRLYDVWQSRSSGTYSARIGELTDLWRAAERSGVLPSHADLARAASTTAAPAWRIKDDGSVVALTSHTLDLNSLGKGYTIGRTVRAVQKTVPAIRGGLINIGGDIQAWGDAPQTGKAWTVAVANPKNSADNAAPLTVLRLRDGAVSSSGNYARGYTIAGHHYSHIIDARTGEPADGNPGVTVIARDNATANALATTLSILPPDEGVRLVESVDGAEALIVTSSGTQVRTKGFSAYEIPGRPNASANVGREVFAVMDVDITMDGFNRHRPYVAAWVSDAAGKHVRTLAMWGNRPKYQRELSKWWSLAGEDYTLVDAVTRATRSAGKYTLEWDGLDQNGKSAGTGPFTFWLEAAYENGPHSFKSVTLSCAKAAAGTIEKTSAFAGAQVRCGTEK